MDKKPGICFANYSDEDAMCKVCYATNQCSKAMHDKIRKKEKSERGKTNKTPQDFHASLIKEISRYFHETKVQKFGDKGLEHQFLNEENQTKCIVKTLLPSMKMKIFTSEWAVVEPLASNNEVDRVVCNIKRTLALEE